MGRWSIAYWLCQRKVIIAGLLVLACVVLVTYAPSFSSGFFLDDYPHLEWAGKLTLSQYLYRAFMPWQTSFYRPIYFIWFLVQYTLFHHQSSYYHLSKTLIHLANCLLLFAIIRQLSSKWRVALLSAVIYAGLPISSGSVFWISVPDPLAVFFYLAAVWFWTRYLQAGSKLHYLLATSAYIFAALSKEISATLPVTLFLIDRLLIRGKIGKMAFMRRYLLLFIVWLAYLVLEYIVHSNGPIISAGAYAVGSHMLFNLVDYLAMLALPWNLGAPLHYIWLLIVSLVCVTIIILRRSVVLLIVGIFALLNIAPVLGSPVGFGTDARYLYASAIGLAVILALPFELVWMHWRHNWYQVIAAAAFAGSVFVNGLGVAEAAATFTETARRQRVPFRDIVRQHPTFAKDTLLFFIAPPTFTPALSGMFFLQYGESIFVRGTYPDGIVWLGGRLRSETARLRDHNAAYVYYFDETGRPIEVKVDKEATTAHAPGLPLNFQVPIRLEGYEVTSSALKQGNVLVLLLYWRAMETIPKDYTVFIHLIKSGEMVFGQDSQPQDGRAPTSSWKANELIVDGHVIPVTSDVPAGNNYRLEIGLYYLPTMERLGIVDATGRVIADTLVIEPFSVVE